VDVRDIDGARRDGVLATIRQACDQTAARRGVRIGIRQINADAPAECDGAVVDALALPSHS